MRRGAHASDCSRVLQITNFQFAVSQDWILHTAQL